MNDMVETIFSLQISSVLSSECKRWSLVLQLSSCLIILVMPLLQSKQSVPFSISTALHCALSNLLMFYLTFAVERRKKKKKTKKNLLPKPHYKEMLNLERVHDLSV